MNELPAWGPSELQELGRKVKQQLRQRMRATRRALSESAVAARSARIVAQLDQLEIFSRARAIGMFWPVEGQGEVDLRELDAELMRRGVARYYPFMDPSDGGYTTGFRRIELADELTLTPQRFRQPLHGGAAARGELDVVLVPALAVTPAGHRLGYGKGFYDVTLGDVCPPARSIVLAYSFQLLAELPLESHDYRCDMVVTDDAVFVTEPAPGHGPAAG